MRTISHISSAEVRSVAGVLFACLLLASCDRGAESGTSTATAPAVSAEDEAKQKAVEAARQAEEDRKARERAAEDKRQAEVRRFVESAQPAVRQLNAMKLRTEAGITMPEYRQKLGEITDAVAAVETPPDDDAAQIVEKLKQALASYNAAQEFWPLEIRNKQRAEELGGGPPDEPSYDIAKDVLKRYQTYAAIRVQRWQEAEKAVSEAAEVLHRLRGGT